MAEAYKVGIALALSSNHEQVLGALSKHLLGVTPTPDRISEVCAHSCPGRVRRHVRSWRKPTPHSKAHRWSTD